MAQKETESPVAINLTSDGWEAVITTLDYVIESEQTSYEECISENPDINHIYAIAQRAKGILAEATSAPMLTVGDSTREKRLAEWLIIVFRNNIKESFIKTVTEQTDINEVTSSLMHELLVQSGYSKRNGSDKTI